MGLDLRKVAHFVAVAEERSMTRAATGCTCRNRP